MIPKRYKGTPVWVCARGRWRLGTVVAMLRKNVVVDYFVPSTRKTVRTRFDPEGRSIQPRSFDPERDGRGVPVTYAPAPKLKV